MTRTAILAQGHRRRERLGAMIRPCSRLCVAFRPAELQGLDQA